MDPTVWASWKDGEDTTSGPAAAMTQSRHILGLRGDRLGVLRNTFSPGLIYPRIGVDIDPSQIKLRNVFRYQGHSTLFTIVTSNFFTLGSTITGGTMAFPEPFTGTAYNVFPDTMATYDTEFVQFRDALFATRGAVTGDTMQVWYGDTSKLGTVVGLPAPTAAPTVVAFNASSGLLDSSPTNITLPYYQWVVVLKSSRGVRGNPSPESAQTTVTKGHAVVTLLATDVPPFIGTDPYDLSFAEFYRRGGYTTQYYYVGQVPVTTAGGVPTANIVFLDGVADIDQGPNIVSYNCYQPPTGLDVLTQHLTRLYAASSTGAGTSGSSIRLWFSGIDVPEQWGILGSGPALEGGYLDCPGGNDDPIYTLSSTGSLLVIGRRRSIYALFGNDFNSFSLVPITRSVGVISKRAMIRCYNDVYFVGTDRRVYRVSDGNAVWMSQQVQATLDAMTLAQIQSSRMTFGQSRLFIAFETGPGDYKSGVALIYDFGDASGWTEEITGYVTDIQALPHPTENHDEIVVVGKPILDGQDGNAHDCSEIRRLFDDTSTLKKQVDYLTVEALSSAQNGIGQGETRAEILYIEGSVDLTGISSGTLAITVQADNYVRTYAINAANGLNAAKNTLARISLHPDIVGRYMQVGLSGFVKSLELVLISLACSLHRDDG